MLKKSFISIISYEEKEEKRGSVAFQILRFTNRIRTLSAHLELHRKDYLSKRGLRKILGKRQRKDYLSKRGLRKILGKRQRMLSYLSKKNRIRYKQLINQLNIRDSKTR